MEKASIKVNVTFKENVLEVLDRYAEEWGLSRSAMLAALVMGKYEQEKAAEMLAKAKSLQDLSQG